MILKTSAAILAYLSTAVVSKDCSSPVWFNEVHYDNSGVDVGEFLEVAGASGTNLSGWSVVLYNGKDGNPYDSYPLSGAIADDTRTGFGFVTLTPNNIQNGGPSPDGFALLDAGGATVQFLSYEGTFTNSAGVVSTDIGVSESSLTPIGTSLQLSGIGSCYTDFTWQLSTAETPGALNNNQILSGRPTLPPTESPTETPTGLPVSSPSTLATIQEIQGSGDTSPLFGNQIAIESVYVTAFAWNGFYVQEKISGKPGTIPSSGLFVLSSLDLEDIGVGDKVILFGRVNEFRGWTQLSLESIEKVDGEPYFFDPIRVELPVANQGFLEKLENMIVEIVPANENVVVVSDYFNLDRFGSITVCAADESKGRMFQYTQLNEPSVEGVAAQEDLINRACVVVDDGQSFQNPDPILLGGLYNLKNSLLRGGSEVEVLRGPLIDDPYSSYYQVRPFAPDDFILSFMTNPRPPFPSIDTSGTGEVSIVSTNVLNFFTSISGASRGADNTQEYDRQREKLLSALTEMDADIFVVIEIENSVGSLDGAGASQAVAEGLSARSSGRKYLSVAIESGIVQVGFQSIKVDIIFDSEKLNLMDAATLDDNGVDQARLDAAGDSIFGTRNRSGKSRSPLLATFTTVNGDKEVSIAANHFKSKGSPCNEDATAPEDGTGSCDRVRTQSSLALLDWIESNPTGAKTKNIVIAGDLNSYAREAPITALLDNGFISVEDLDQTNSPAYSYVFGGKFGTLDYILVHKDAISNVDCHFTWHVNADEADAIDYNLDFGRPSDLFDGSTPYRFSDHDPLFIKMDLNNGRRSGGSVPICR